MKNIVILVMLLLSVEVSLAQKIKGSDTVLPLSQKVAEVFMKKFPGTMITVTGGGSGIGISSLVDGNTELAMASRKIKFDEKMKMQNAGKKVVEVIIARDALSIIVNPKNKVTNLTREQIEGIFTGKIKNWKEVGGDNLPIVAYARETTSGTYEYFKEFVLKNKNYKSGILSMPATGAIIQSVSQTPGAVAYVGMAYVNKEVKDIHVSYDQGKTFVEPTLENALSGKYPIVRPLFYYYEARSEAKVKPFINFVLSQEGQQLVKTVGYIERKK